MNSVVGRTDRRTDMTEMSGTELGKRDALMMDVGLDFEWMPGAGIPFSPFGEAAEVERRSKAMKTSLLFSQLEAEVDADAEAARTARHASDCREWQISAEIAARFPMRVDEAGAEEHAPASVSATAAQANQSLKSMPFPAMQFHEVKIDHGAVMRHREPALPAPLTQPSLEKVFTQLPDGARNTVQCVLQTWRNGRLGNDDLVETVRSFAGSSVVIRELFGNLENPGEVASRADMQELMAQQI